MLNRTAHSIDELKKYILIHHNFWKEKVKSIHDIEIIDYGTPDGSNCLNIIHKIRYKKHWYSKAKWQSSNLSPGADFEKELKKIKIQLRKEKLKQLKQLIYEKD